MKANVIFCESIRQEKDGRYSLIGTFNDKIIVPGKGLIPRLSYLVFLSFDKGEKIPDSIDIIINYNNEEEIISFGRHKSETDVFERNVTETIGQDIIPFRIDREEEINVFIKSNLDKKRKPIGTIEIAIDKKSKGLGFIRFEE